MLSSIPSSPTKEALLWLDKNEQASFGRLFKFLSIRSVSTLSKYTKDVGRAADFLEAQFREIGATKVTQWKTAGHPAVFATWQVNKKLPTVLVYGHYDVQPAEPLKPWKSDPFKPVIRGGNIVARGSTDDKGQVMVHIEALRAFAKTAGKPPVNLKFLIEGEEEVGSTNLESLIKNHKKELVSDAIVISDSGVLTPGIPALTVGLRGLVYFELIARGAAIDLHSGEYGGAVANPLNALMTIIAKMRDDNGKVTIKEFYKDVVMLSTRDKKNLTNLAFDEKEFSKTAGVSSLEGGERGFSTLERVWTRPSFDVNGFIGGFTEEGSKTVLPAEARVKVSMRLVPNQDPKHIMAMFKKAVREHTPKGITVEIITHNMAEPYLADTKDSVFDVAKQALAQTYGKEAMEIRAGGTIPVVTMMAKHLQVPIVLMGFSLPDANIHGPNEKFAVDSFRKGTQSVVRFLLALADRSKSAKK